MTQTREWLTPVVKRAMVETVVNIGQLSRAEKLQLEYAVRHGYLSKGQGGPFPKLKTVYAHPRFDFAATREAWVEYFMEIHKLDVARGVVSR